jgi:hypothetical protein
MIATAIASVVLGRPRGTNGAEIIRSVTSHERDYGNDPHRECGSNEPQNCSPRHVWTPYLMSVAFPGSA